MLKNFWWPVEFSHNVTTAAMPMTALGQRFVLWRDNEGKVNCLSDLCVHRGGALSAGWTKNGCVVDQFEQHIRAITGWPLGDAEQCTTRR